MPQLSSWVFLRWQMSLFSCSRDAGWEEPGERRHGGGPARSCRICQAAANSPRSMPRREINFLNEYIYCK